MPKQAQPVMVRRVEATQATLNEWRGKPFEWGKRDCVRLAASHLRRMGHQVKLPSSGSYRSLRTARARLKERGHSNVIEALDAMGLERIAPAEAVAGDILAWPAEDEMGALAILLSNGRSIAFHEHSNAAEVLQIVQVLAAWRVYPK